MSVFACGERTKRSGRYGRGSPEAFEERCGEWDAPQPTAVEARTNAATARILTFGRLARSSPPAVDRSWSGD
jgi:hypothetical protein